MTPLSFLMNKRVIVMLQASTLECVLLGPGTIVGQHDSNPGCPLIRLDTGEYTAGCRIWWCEEEKFEERMTREHPFAIRKVVPLPEWAKVEVPEGGFTQFTMDDGAPSTLADIVDKPKYLN